MVDILKAVINCFYSEVRLRGFIFDTFFRPCFASTLFNCYDLNGINIGNYLHKVTPCITLFGTLLIKGRFGKLETVDGSWMWFIFQIPLVGN